VVATIGDRGARAAATMSQLRTVLFGGGASAVRSNIVGSSVVE
jgi:hypothetical protein